MSDIGLYVSAINIPDYYENTRGYYGVKVVSVLFVFGYPFILEKTLKTIRFNTYEKLILRKPLVDGTYLCCKTFHGGL